MALLYERAARRLTAQNGGFRPGQELAQRVEAGLAGSADGFTFGAGIFPFSGVTAENWSDENWDALSPCESHTDCAADTYCDNTGHCWECSSLASDWCDPYTCEDGRTCRSCCADKELRAHCPARVWPGVAARCEEHSRLRLLEGCTDELATCTAANADCIAATQAAVDLNTLPPDVAAKVAVQHLLRCMVNDGLAALTSTWAAANSSLASSTDFANEIVHHVYVHHIVKTEHVAYRRRKGRKGGKGGKDDSETGLTVLSVSLGVLLLAALVAVGVLVSKWRKVSRSIIQVRQAHSMSQARPDFGDATPVRTPQAAPVRGIGRLRELHLPLPYGGVPLGRGSWNPQIIAFSL
jgi:hypothetical protein